MVLIIVIIIVTIIVAIILLLSLLIFLSYSLPNIKNNFIEIWLLMLMREYGINMGAGITSLLWPATQFYIINRPIPGEHLREQSRQLINSLTYFNKFTS